MNIIENFYGKLQKLREDYDKNKADDAKEVRDIGSGSRRKKERRIWMDSARMLEKQAVTGMSGKKEGEKRVDEEQLDELKGLTPDTKKKLQARIRDKHDKAWDDTTEIRKKKKSVGSADTKKIDAFRNRLGKIHNKLDEEQSDLDKQIDFHNQGLANANYKGISATHHRKVLRKLMKQKNVEEKK